MDFGQRAPFQIGIGLQPGSELKQVLDHHVLKMVQSGLVRSLFSKWVLRRGPEDRSARFFVEDAEAVGSENLYFPTAVVAIGVALGAAFLSAEKLHSVRSRMSQGTGAKLFKTREKD